MRQGCGVRSELLGDDHRRREALALQQLGHQLDGRSASAPALDQDLEDFALVVDGAPKVHPLAADPDHHLVEVPLRSGTRAVLAQSPREHRPELDDPVSDGFVRDVETAFGEQLLDVAVALTKQSAWRCYEFTA